MKRSQFVSWLIAVSLVGGSQFAQAADPAHPDQPLVAPADALSRLKEGNGRFTAGNPQHPHESADERKRMATDSYENAGAIPLGMTSEQAAKRRAELANSQHPFAIILSCSDSRVPPEIVFDEGLGDLFIVRVAGNVLNDEGLGSIEYGVEVLGARLIVVLGHSSCGAVDAAMKTVAAKGKAPGHIQSLVSAIKPVVDSMPKADLETMTKANAKHVVDRLRSSTPILKARVESGEVQVIGGYYTLETGGVGRDELREFYSKRFIPQMPPDTEMTPVSRTIGEDQLVDEMIFKFTHTIPMDWMLPGVAPTGKRVEVPLVAIVRFRGGRLAHEHIYWDQASVLVQIGLIDPAKLPVAGVESARKVVDPTLPANALMKRADLNQ